MLSTDVFGRVDCETVDHLTHGLVALTRFRDCAFLVHDSDVGTCALSLLAFGLLLSGASFNDVVLVLASFCSLLLQFQFLEEVISVLLLD